MAAKRTHKESPFKKYFHIAAAALACVVLVVAVYVVSGSDFFTVEYKAVADIASSTPPKPTLDKAAYDLKLLELAHISTSTIARLALAPLASTTNTSLSTFTAASLASSSVKHWPVRTPYPLYGALLPENRIVAYYGNFYSTAMGVLGEYPAPQMLQMLEDTVAQWQAADPSTPVMPAIDYIAVTAQGSAGADGKYRARMPDSQIQEALDLASQVHGIVFLDLQVGLSDLQTEVPLLKQYLALPNVELAVDPEFAMHRSEAPGTVIGTFDASDINWTAQYLAQIVTANNLPPKILVVHRFTEEMVTNTQDIEPLPQVQIVMDMDGWGSPSKKIGTYTYFIEDEPVQFTGFKLFYKNDLKPPSPAMMTPAQVLKLTPAPSYIQYQ